MPVTLLGAGRQAREIASLLDSHGVRVEGAFVADGYTRDSWPAPSEDPAPFLRAVGSPLVSRQLADDFPGTAADPFLHRLAWVDSTAEVGDGSVIFPMVVLGHAVTVGPCCLVNYAATISHDATLGEHVTISPGVNVGGGAVIEDGAFIGIGAALMNDVRVGAGAVVGAGACVVRDVPPLTVVAGTPARELRRSSDWLGSI